MQIAESIRQEILTGRLQKEESLPSQRILAQQYRVSLITIKSAINRLVHEGYLYSRVGVGTFVASRSPSVKADTHRTIGLALRDLSDPFFSLIIHSIERQATDEGYNVLVKSNRNRVERADTQIDHFLKMGVDGLIIASMSHLPHATEKIRELHDLNIPYVVVSYIGDPDIYYVGTDHEEGAFLATQHLIQVGYQHIGFINAESGNVLGELRKKGYCRALEEYDRPIDRNFILSMNRNDFQSGYEIGQQFGSLSERPDAVFVFSDIAALGFEQAVLNDGFRVPQDIAIVGFDDIERDLYAPVPLTTVHQPTREIGELAFDMVHRRIKGEDIDHRIILKPRLVIRKSCSGSENDVRLHDERISLKNR